MIALAATAAAEEQHQRAEAAIEAARFRRDRALTSAEEASAEAERARAVESMLAPASDAETDSEGEWTTDKAGNTSLDTYHLLEDAETGEIYAEGYAKIVWFDRKTRKSAPLPDTLRALAAR